MNDNTKILSNIKVGDIVKIKTWNSPFISTSSKILYGTVTKITPTRRFKVKIGNNDYSKIVAFNNEGEHIKIEKSYKIIDIDNNYKFPPPEIEPINKSNHVYVLIHEKYLGDSIWSQIIIDIYENKAMAETKAYELNKKENGVWSNKYTVKKIKVIKDN